MQQRWLATRNHFWRMAMAGCLAIALAACGSDEEAGTDLGSIRVDQFPPVALGGSSTESVVAEGNFWRVTFVYTAHSTTSQGLIHRRISMLVSTNDIGRFVPLNSTNCQMVETFSGYDSTPPTVTFESNRTEGSFFLTRLQPGVLPFAMGTQLNVTFRNDDTNHSRVIWNATPGYYPMD